ncbi:MAG TPA: glycosyltransferase, partial [Oligoflexia bacterium]|nr:glycosyltransferase [Oligoflexia bacterium]
LVIAGPDDTEYADYLKKMVKSLELEHRVHFTGHTDGQVKEALLAKAKCLILPSYTENFGIVVTEALAQGTPVIASKGTPWEVLNTYKAGFWVDNSSDELCKALNKMLSLSSDQYDQYVNNSIRLVDEMYNVDKQIHKWIDLYQQLSENEG